MAELKDFENSLKKIRKKYEAGSVMQMGAEGGLNVEVISTGSIGLDKALGVGGIPKGRLIELFGPPAIGKSTIALHTLANAQKDGGWGVYIDAENAINRDYAEKLGLNLDHIFLSQPTSAEESLDIIKEFASNGNAEIIILDSVASMPPEAEIESEIGDSHMGVRARLLSKFCRQIPSVLQKTDTALLLVNQVRSTMSSWGPSKVTPGGKAIKFHSSVRIKLYYSSKIEDSEGEKIGNEVVARVAKNKLSPPFREAKFSLIYGEGISRERELIRLGIEEGIVEKAGSWYSYKEELKEQGKENTCEFLQENPEIAEEIKRRILGEEVEEEEKSASN